MNNHLFIAPGDIMRIRADAIVYSAATHLGPDGSLYPSFEAQLPDFEPWFTQLRKQHGGSCKVGDHFWLPLKSSRPPYGVVVAVAAGAGSPPDEKPRLAVRAALSRAVSELRALGKTERLLVALPAFRVGRGGDRQRRLLSARLQVETALETLAGLDRVDAAFITYTPTLYQIFAEARRQVLGPAAVVPPTVAPERCQALEDALRAGECVLFVGAGLSRGTGLPDWSELIARLAGDLGIKSQGLDYLDLAQWYRERFGPRALAEVMQQAYGRDGALPTLAHYLLLSLPIRLVLTTNYDDLLEHALTALKRYPVKVVTQRDVARIRAGQGAYVVKLHGDAATAEEIVLCRDDYDEFFERRPAMALLLEGLLLNRTFFFVGYGLRDPNFRQIYSRIARMLQDAARPAFATSFETGSEHEPYLTQQWRRKQLHLLTMTGKDTAEQERQFLCFLDGLAERVALRTPGLFLAPDVASAPPLARLRQLLVEDVGRELVQACQRLSGGSPAGELRHLAEVLEFLTEHGWRPEPGHGWDLCRLWEHLAAQAADPAEQRRLLIQALDHAEALAHVRRIRGKLETVREG